MAHQYVHILARRMGSASHFGLTSNAARFLDELGDDVRMPDKPSSADAKASGSDRLAALKAMLG